MASKQEQFFLEANREKTNERLHKILVDTKKEFEKASKTVAILLKHKGGGLGEISTLDKTIAALKRINLDEVISVLNGQRSALAQSRDETLRHRREQLARSAKEAGWPVKRLKEYDFVGGFEVRYKLEQVKLRLGSEELTTFDELDGARLFLRLQEEKSKLEGFPFVRPDFIESIKDAIHLARRLEKDRNGKVPIRTLYPLFVLVRQSRDERFIKRPVTKSFTEYSMAQFVFDLARFGQDGWKTDRGERLSNQGPNMASISGGATVTLPSLDGDGSGGPQLGALWIERA